MSNTTTINRTQVRNTIVGKTVTDAGTVVAEDVVVGFKPRYVKVFSLSERVALEWYEGMTDAHALKTVANGTRTHETSAGITVSENGFTIGTDSGLRPNEQSFTLNWECFE